MLNTRLRRCAQVIEVRRSAGVGKTGNEVQRLEDDVGGPIPVRRLERVANVAVRRERQPFFRDRRTGDVAAQPFQLLAFICLGRHAGVQRETSHLADRIAKWIFRITNRQGLQGEHLAPCLRTHGDAVGDGMPEPLIHHTVFTLYAHVKEA